MVPKYKMRLVAEDTFIYAGKRKRAGMTHRHDPAKALEVAVCTRISFARLLLLTYNLLHQGQC